MLDDRGARIVRDPHDQMNAALDILVKDMGLVLDAARQHGCPSPLLDRRNDALATIFSLGRSGTMPTPRGTTRLYDLGHHSAVRNRVARARGKGISVADPSWRRS